MTMDIAIGMTIVIGAALICACLIILAVAGIGALSRRIRK